MPISFSIRKLIGIGLASITLGFVSFISQEQITFKDIFSQKAVLSSSKVVDFDYVPLPQIIQIFYSPDSIFLDVRDEKYYNYGHIQNALNLPMSELESKLPSLLKSLQASPNIVIYCNGPSCGVPIIIAKRLVKENVPFNHIKIYIQGWPEWRSCHLPMTVSDAFQHDLTKENASPGI